MYNESYHHYIITRPDGAITDTWSDGPLREKDITNAFCINTQGGYQFRFSEDGEENPSIYDIDGIPLYKWDGSKVVTRSTEEIEAERSTFSIQPPSSIEQLRADVDFMAVMLGVKL